MSNCESIYNQNDATGFIKLNALRLRVKAMVEKQAKKARRPCDESDCHTS